MARNIEKPLIGVKEKLFNAIMAGFQDFGLAQSDIQYQAVMGLINWAKKGPQRELRSVFSIHHEQLTLVAAVDAGIKSIADKSFYTKSRIQVQQLYPGLKQPQEDVDTFGVIATLCTAIRVPEEVVYSLTEVIFENFDGFRRRHPALVNLTKEGRLKGLSAPFHPGAQKYFRAAGLMK